MPAPVSESLVYLPLFLLLGIAAVAVAVAERRSRRVLLADGGPWPDTERYARRPSFGLSAIEAVRVFRHPLLWLGVAGAAVTATVYARGVGGVTDILLPIFGPLLVGLFAAIHLGVGRDRHTGMTELGRTLPVGVRTRTVAHLLAAAWIAVPVAVAVVATVFVLLGTSRDFEGWTLGALEYLQPAFAVLIVVALAVAAGRWWRHPTAAFLIPVLLFFSPMLWGVALYMDAGPKTVWQTDHYLGTITATHLAWHWLFLAGYLAVAVTGALARHDRRPLFLTLAGLGLAAMVIGYVVKLPSWWWLA